MLVPDLSTPPRSPSGAPHFWGPVFTVFRGPVSTLPRQFLVPGPRIFGAPPGARFRKLISRRECEFPAYLKH